MTLSDRIELLTVLGEYIKQNSEEWQAVKERAERGNSWFTQDFIQLASVNIAEVFLQKDSLESFAAHYHLDDNVKAQKVGIVMAGNIPLVGFHDFLCCFLSGHIAHIKLSSKDNILLPFLLQKIAALNTEVNDQVVFSEMLKECDAYIATGSNNSGRYFEYYFSKYPHIIRKNKTSVAVLCGEEREDELAALAADIHTYYGLGCRNVTKLFVPDGYNFEKLIDAFKPYNHFADHNKYKNNYDYQLSIALLNNVYYMTNGATLLLESGNTFSPIAVLYYEFYDKVDNINIPEESVQCTVGRSFTSFGGAQVPGLFDYADGVDTLQFLLSL